MDTPQEKPTAIKKRGALLTLLLILYMFISSIGILVLLLGGTLLTSLSGALGGGVAAGFTGTIFGIGLVAMISALVLTIFVFKWKKWAAYTMAVLIGIALLGSLFSGPTVGQFIGQAFLPALFGFALWKKWQFFE